MNAQPLFIFLLTAMTFITGGTTAAEAADCHAVADAALLFLCCYSAREDAPAARAGGKSAQADGKYAQADRTL